MCFPEPHSSKQIEDFIRLGSRRHPRGTGAEAAGSRPDQGAAIEDWCRASQWRVLAGVPGAPGTSDQSHFARQRIAELTGGDLISTGGRRPPSLARDPVKINLLIRDFALSVSR